jgi:hypothetical protein
LAKLSILKGLDIILETVETETVDDKEITKMMQTLRFPEDWKIIMIRANKSELKQAHRIFAMMVFEMHSYFCVIE